MSPDARVLVVGGGPIGLGVAGALKREGISALVLEREQTVGVPWRRRYDSLSLNTSRFLSRLPGASAPRGRGHWATRDEYVRSLEDYATRLALDVRFDTTVERIDREDDAWRLKTSSDAFTAPIVVVATGQSRVPFIPPWPGLDATPIPIVHSSGYRNAEPYREKDVLVVGAGDSAADIVLDLVAAGASRVLMSIRTSPFILPATFGIPPDWTSELIKRIPPRIADRMAARLRRLILGNLTPYGLPDPTGGIYTTYLRTRAAPIIDRRGFVRTLKRRAFEVVAAVEGFDGADVRLADGSRITPDAVIAATGYKPGLEDLVGHLGVLTAEGLPRATIPKAAAPGLFFAGFGIGFGGHLREGRKEALALLRLLRRRY